MLLATACLIAPPRIAFAADDLPKDLAELRALLQKEIANLKKQEQRLSQEILRLDQKSQLLDRQLQSLRAAGVGSTNGSSPAPAPRQNTGARVAQAPPPAGGPAGQRAAPSDSAPSPESEAAPISGPSSEEQQARRVLETAPTLSSSGGVLTPRGQISIEPSLEYDYWSNNRLGVNGFQIIPGITFGNIFVNRVEQNIATAAVTVRAGITDRLELNLKVPYVYNYSSTNSVIPVGANAQLLSVSASNSDIGDIQLGASYQINAGLDGWPIFVGNFLFKTITGVSPFEVPIVTLNDPNGQFLQGIPTKTATGTGFYSIQPSVTLLYPTAPGVLFANLQYIYNFGRRVNIQDPQGGPGIPTDLTPGSAIAFTFGMGFSLNERTSMTLSYQQQYVFSATQNGQTIRGSEYGFGTFNFAIGYEVSQSTRVNVSVGVGAGPNTPVARVLLAVPYRFSL